MRVMSATIHEAPYVLAGLKHHRNALRVGTQYTDTGGTSDHILILCAVLGFRFCPRPGEFPIASSLCPLAHRNASRGPSVEDGPDAAVVPRAISDGTTSSAVAAATKKDRPSLNLGRERTAA